MPVSGARTRIKEVADHDPAQGCSSAVLNREGNRSVRFCGQATLWRSGFSLLELLIVLVLLVTILAIAWPSVRRMTRRADIKQLALGLQEKVADTRIQAIQSGQTFIIRFKESGDRIELGPVSRFPAADSSADTSATDGFESIEVGNLRGNDDGNRSAPIETILLDSIRVTNRTRAELESRSESRPGGLLSAVTAAKKERNGDQDWIQIRLTPDGRGQDSRFTLIDTETGVALELFVRGLTGHLEIGTPFNVDPAELGLDTKTESPGEEPRQADELANDELANDELDDKAEAFLVEEVP